MIKRVKEIGAGCVIITNAASDLGKMQVRLALKAGITPICSVFEAEQILMLKAEIKGLDHVFSMADDFKEICMA